MPHIDISGFENNPNVNKLGDLFTVGMIVNFVETRLQPA